MTLSNDDLEKLVRAIRPQRDFSGMWDQFTRVLTTLTAAGIIWLLQSASDLKGEFAVMKNQQETMGESIKELKQSASAPRFTLSDYQQQIGPLIEALKRNEEDIRQLRSDFANMDRTLLKLEKPTGAK